MTSRLAGFLALLMAFIPQTRDESARPSTTLGTITGVVVTDEPSPQPVRRARVTLSGPTGDLGRSGGAGGPGASVMIGTLASVTTDDNGRFTFNSLSAGVYFIDAVKSPFVVALFGGRRQPGTMVTLTESKPGEDVTIKMVKGSAISGVVRDQDGQPFQGVSVTATSTGASGQDMRSATVRTTTTDDLGRYRLSALPPGEFVIDATISDATGTATDSIRAMQPGEVQRTIQQARTGVASAAELARMDRGTTAIWGRVFYPGTTDRAAAAAVTIAAGDERGNIDIQMQLVTTNRIEGTVTMPYGAPAQNVRVTVRPVDESQSASLVVDDKRTARTDAVGHYAISSLMSGTYEVLALNATASPSAGQISVRSVTRGETSSGDPALWASAQAVVAGQDVTVPLALQPGVSISGQIIFEGSEPSVLEVYRQRVSIRYTASNLTPPPIQIEPTGKFQLAGVIPGSYDVMYAGGATGRSWTLKAATADGVDVREAPMAVRAGQDIRALTLTLTDRPSRLTATLAGVDNARMSRFTVIVFPVDRARWGSRTRVQQLVPGAGGAFVMVNLPDGDYLVAAVLDIARDWNTPSALERLATSAARVTIASGKDTVCELRAGG